MPDIERPALLVLCRHAESLRNVVKAHNVYLPDDDTADRVRGVPDQSVPLTEAGIQQALGTGPVLRERFGIFDVVYDSGYRRTVQTREALLAAYPPEEMSQMKIRQSDLLRERDVGYTYDMTTEEVDRHFPWLKDHWKTFGYFYSRPPGGKSQADLCDQVYPFLGMLFNIRRGNKILVVTHGGTIRAFRYHLEKWTHVEYERNMKEQPGPANCSLTVYRYAPETRRLELSEYNTVHWT